MTILARHLWLQNATALPLSWASFPFSIQGAFIVKTPDTPQSSPTGGSFKPTLGLTGLTANAAALIAPGAFLWLTFAEQSSYGAPGAAAAMWLGMFTCLLLCLATAISYGQLAKLYPGAGSSYFFAEQAFLAKKKAF